MDYLRRESIQQLRTLVEAAGRIAIVGHTHPDGDALGSTVALSLFLKNAFGKKVACLYPDTPADNLLFLLPQQVTCLFHDRQADESEQCILDADLVFLLDCNCFSRTEGLQKALEASRAPKVLIDHHLNPDTDAFNLVFSTPDISSASELLYWILKALGWSPELPASDHQLIGFALMAGMTTDTNNFANSVYPSTFRMASELIAAGVDRDALLQIIYFSYRENRVRLMGYMQNEGLHILPGGAAYMIITREIQQRFDLRDGESEGLVNVPLSIGKVRLSLLAKEDDGHFRISVRSKKGTSAQQLAQRYFHGGGHENAAGGKLYPGSDIAGAADAAAYIENALKAFLA